MSFTSHARMHVPDEAVRHFVDRAYREGKTYQWVRETFKNSYEADATRIEFGIEPQAAANSRVMRRTVIDNGHGMEPEHLKTFFKMLGVGGKSVGGPHENFAIGAKVSLLPWNPYGLVVISRKLGIDGMIWISRDEHGNYGLREWEMDSEPDSGVPQLLQVVAPFDDIDHGCDWSKIFPDWVEDHGTAIILLGNSATSDTVDGDPSRSDELDARGIHKYLGGRLSRLDANLHVTVVCKEKLASRSTTRRESRDVILTTRDDGTFGAHQRTVHGLEALIARDRTYPTGNVIVDEFGTSIRWVLRDADAPAITDFLPYSRSFISVEYMDELYHPSSHTATFRMFGIAHDSVARRVWLTIVPPRYDAGTGTGVYPNQARSSLYWRGNDLPMTDWASAFARSLPEEIQHVLSEAYASDASESTIGSDKERRERLGARFGKRWRAVRYVLSSRGTIRAVPSEGQVIRVRPPALAKKVRTQNGRGGAGGSSSRGPTRIGVPDVSGTEFAEARRVGIDLPHSMWVSASSLSEEAWAAAVFVPSEGESGTIHLNQDHPIFESEIKEWQATRSNHLAPQVASTVQEVYADLAVAHVAHVRNLAGVRVGSEVISSDRVSKMLEPEALTCALTGLLGAEAMIQTRLGGRFGRATSA